jgi:hypothetical protein
MDILYFIFLHKIRNKNTECKCSPESIPKNRFRQPMQPGGPVRQICRYRPATLKNRFLGSLKGFQKGAQGGECTVQ